MEDDWLDYSHNPNATYSFFGNPASVDNPLGIDLQMDAISSSGNEQDLGGWSLPNTYTLSSLFQSGMNLYEDISNLFSSDADASQGSVQDNTNNNSSNASAYLPLILAFFLLK